MSKNRWVLVNRNTGIVMGQILSDTEQEGSEKNFAMRHTTAQILKHRFLLAEPVVGKISDKVAEALVMEEYEDLPQDDELEYKANEAIKAAVTELSKYNEMPALITNQAEFDQYKADMNTAIATQERKDLVLPTKPSWFI